MENRYRWMEDSLKRTAELSLEVLERARRREVDWTAMCTHRREAGMLEEDNHASLEEAFATMADFMKRTTEHCETYHNCIPVHRTSKQEMNHICRFHCRKPVQRHPGSTQSLSMDHLQDTYKNRTPQDVCIEVAPGTYSISAGVHNSHRQTKVVNITPGQSVDLTFNL
ncbi:A-kinase-interacting protein 1 isoform 1-T3 [Discoglossus pictus]